MLDFKPVEPFRVIDHIFGAFFGEHQIIRRMGTASGGFVIAFGQSFESVLSNRREHYESSFGIDLLHLLRQALVHHRSHAVQYVEA